MIVDGFVDELIVDLETILESWERTNSNSMATGLYIFIDHYDR
jgi:hypothetical protein